MANKLIDWRQVRAGARGAVEGFLGNDEDLRRAREAQGYVQGVREQAYMERQNRAVDDGVKKIALGVLALAVVAAAVGRMK